MKKALGLFISLAIVISMFSSLSFPVSAIGAYDIIDFDNVDPGFWDHEGTPGNTATVADDGTGNIVLYQQYGGIDDSRVMKAVMYGRNWGTNVDVSFSIWVDSGVVLDDAFVRSAWSDVNINMKNHGLDVSKRDQWQTVSFNSGDIEMVFFVLEFWINSVYTEPGKGVKIDDIEFGQKPKPFWNFDDLSSYDGNGAVWIWGDGGQVNYSLTSGSDAYGGTGKSLQIDITNTGMPGVWIDGNVIPGANSNSILHFKVKLAKDAVPNNNLISFGENYNGQYVEGRTSGSVFNANEWYDVYYACGLDYYTSSPLWVNFLFTCMEWQDSTIWLDDIEVVGSIPAGAITKPNTVVVGNIKEYIDEDTGIKITVPRSVYGNNANLVVDKLTSGTVYTDIESNIVLDIENDRLLDLYDIYFTNASGEKLRSDYTASIFNIKIPIPENENLYDLVLFNAAESGNVSRLNAQIKDRYVNVITNSIGFVALAKQNNNGYFVPSVEASQKFSYTYAPGTDQELTMQYRLFLPENYNPNIEYPVLIALHGIYESGTDNIKNLDNIATLTDRMINNERDGNSCIMIVPQYPSIEDYYHYSAVDATMAIIDEVYNNYSADQNRLYATGISAGGKRIYELIAKYPNRFTAVTPMCAGLHLDLVDSIKHVPIWTFDGGLDQLGVYPNSLQMVNALMSAGADVQHTVYPDLDHVVWHRAWSEPDFISWMFSKAKAEVQLIGVNSGGGSEVIDVLSAIGEIGTTKTIDASTFAVPDTWLLRSSSKLQTVTFGTTNTIKVYYDIIPSSPIYMFDGSYDTANGEVSVTIANNTEEQIEVMFIMATYNQAGIMTGTKTQIITLPAKYRTNVNQFIGNNQYMVKCFVWNVTTFVPYCNAMTILT